MTKCPKCDKAIRDGHVVVMRKGGPRHKDCDNVRDEFRFAHCSTQWGSDSYRCFRCVLPDKHKGPCDMQKYGPNWKRLT